jgi:hypothetical protein
MPLDILVMSLVEDKSEKKPQPYMYFLTTKKWRQASHHSSTLVSSFSYTCGFFDVIAKWVLVFSKQKKLSSYNHEKENRVLFILLNVVKDNAHSFP